MITTEQIIQERDLYLRLLSLSSQEDLAPLLQEALTLIIEVTQAQRGYLALYDDQDEPRWWMAKNFSSEEVKQVRQELSQGVIAAALSTGNTIISDAGQDPRFQMNESVMSHEIRAVLCAPIRLKNPVGVLYLQGKPTLQEAFTQEDQRNAELFSRHLAPLMDRLLLKKENQALLDPTAPLRARLRVEGILGKSPALATVLQQIEKAARFELTALLRGPSGTGKTAIARAIHENSARAKGPFIELNCAAIPETLFESELFGALAGAHSTATKRLPGKILAAEGGTLFLDEIGELPLTIQAKLLQLLQSKEYFPLGSSKAEKANVRVLAATNIALEEAIRQKRFREDLFYRLRVMTLQIPSLAERKDDIPLLMQYFCSKTCEQHSIPPLAVSFEALRMAEINDWPGNVRELQNMVEVATINAAMEEATELLPHHLFPETPATEQRALYQNAMRGFQRQFIQSALQKYNWNITEAAKRLGLSRSYLHQLMQGLGLHRG